MSKAAVVFWSQTGNTEEMANAVAEGAKSAGAQVELREAESFSAADADNFDAFAFGCPAMGDEVLEEDIFEPMFSAVEGSLAGKKVVLFGSYGWGDGEWMRSWEQRCREKGITLAADSVICQETPDADALAQCRALGAVLA